MNTQHTPGPWTVFEKPTLADGPNFLVLDEVGNLIVDCGHDEDRALLIASAPDLLKERDELREQLETGANQYALSVAQNAELLEALKVIYLELQTVVIEDVRKGNATLAIKTDTIRAIIRNTISKATGEECQTIQERCESEAISKAEAK